MNKESIGLVSGATSPSEPASPETVFGGLVPLSESQAKNAKKSARGKGGASPKSKGIAKHRSHVQSTGSGSSKHR